MDILNSIFQLGVVLATFSFIWSFVTLGLRIISSHQNTSIQYYLLKTIQYLFLIQVFLVFNFNPNSEFQLNQTSLSVNTLILLMYFVGQIQNRKKSSMSFRIQLNQLKIDTPRYNMKYEIGVITISAIFFILCLNFNDLFQNPISLWFVSSIQSLDNAFLIGTIFKIVGFFFMLSIIGKFVGSLFLITQRTTSETPKDNDSFDDYEEIS